jgi:CRP/FNR family transcriptional regulator, cyclic AMP receptor protein
MAAVTPGRDGAGLLLDVDPDLGADIGHEDWESARQACRGVLVRRPAGRWEPLLSGEEGALVGLVIVTGVICREVQLRDRHLLELLGPGDVLQLPVSGDGPRLGTDVQLTALVDAEMLALGQPFIRAAARWPSLLLAVQQRLEAVRERLAMQALIAHLPRAEHRLLLMMWHLAQRWGVVTPAGIVVPLALSHDVLGQLTAARRSTATLALRALEQAGTIKRLQDGSWLLTTAGELAVEAIAGTPGGVPALGEILALRLRSSEAIEQARALRAEAKLAQAPRGRVGFTERA